MQSIYVMHQNNSDNLEKQENFLNASLENSFDLYLIMVSSLIEIRNKEVQFIDISKKKYLATPEEQNPNLKFVNNQIMLSLTQSSSLNSALEKRKITNWQTNDDTILMLLQDIKESELYINYMNKKGTSFEEDRSFIADLFSDIIAPNERLYSYLEDFKMTWVDDIPVINTQILKQLKQFSKTDDFKVAPIYKDLDDKDFSLALFRKTVLNEDKLEKEFSDKTPNWDMSRMAEIDIILLKMAICEFLHFPSIPFKVTINEYLELAKEYSTPKSSFFINGILDNVVKDYLKTDKLNKIGRGLI